MAVTISIANQKGGVAKTTTALNLSAALTYASKNVLLMDIDPQANATASLVDEYENRVKNAYTVFLNPATIGDNIIPTNHKSLSLLPGTPGLLNLERNIGHMEDKVERLFQARKYIEAQYDYIIIDCPPSLTLMPINSFIASDYVIVPIQCEYFSMEGLSQIIDVINEIRDTKNLGLRLMGILMTMYDDQVESAKEVIDQVRGVFNERVFATIVPRDVSLSEAPSHGISILEYDISSHGALSYIKLAEEVLEHGEDREKAD
ncbi:ParA family protein [Planctomycetota bacterium]